jgi:hypothetical protein
MSTPPVSTVGLEMPDDFEYDSYEAVDSVIGPLRDKYQPQWSEYVTAWCALAYRFCAFEEYDESFTRSITTPGGDAPQPSERWQQERDLFGFFVTGLSLIEHTCYGLYAIASMLDEPSFPIKTPKDKKNITPPNTAKRFRKTFPKEDISRDLDNRPRH